LREVLILNSMNQIAERLTERAVPEAPTPIARYDNTELTRSNPFEGRLSSVNIIELGQLRNCFRCGAEFRGESGKRICPDCSSPRTAKKPLNPNLSFRERQVVKLVCQAKLNKEIAFELHLAEGTIKEYLNRIFRKVGASNRTELAIWALTTGQESPQPLAEAQ